MDLTNRQPVLSHSFNCQLLKSFYWPISTGVKFFWANVLIFEVRHWESCHFFLLLFFPEYTRTIKYKSIVNLAFKNVAWTPSSKCIYLSLWILLSHAKMKEHLEIFISIAASAMAADPRVKWPSGYQPAAMVPVLASGSSTSSGPVTKFFPWLNRLDLCSPVFPGPVCFLSLVLQASYWCSELLLYVLLINPFSASLNQNWFH